MKTGMILVKLISVWAFLWFQAVQLDHTVDADLEQHHTCLFCKSAADSADDSIHVPELHEHVSSPEKHIDLVDQTPKGSPNKDQAARAPPFNI